MTKPIDVAAYLRRFGYVLNATRERASGSPLAAARSSTAAFAPQPQGGSITESLQLFQRRAGLGVTGELDDATRRLMETARCAMPDDAIAAAIPVPWDRRDLRIAFGDLSGTNVLESDLKAAVLAACQTWESAGVGLTLTEVNSGEDIRVECRPSNDPDFDMTGIVVAHADYPPGASVISTLPPLPCHFDTTETIWSLDPGAEEHDVETVALHEIGHCLGLKHHGNKAAAMYTFMPKGRVQRVLHSDDLVLLRDLYP
mgnify:CR=1 FL=1